MPEVAGWGQPSSQDLTLDGSGPAPFGTDDLLAEYIRIDSISWSISVVEMARFFKSGQPRVSSSSL